jgi:phosphoserine phosphatase
MQMINNDYYIVRHGESENNILEIDVSKIENKHLYGLTEKGRGNIEKHAANYNSFDYIFTSPLRRATETAEIFASHTKCPVIIDERLIELNFGDFDLSAYGASGISEKQMRADKELSQPNGENWRQLEERILNFYREINSKYHQKSILIVTHGVCVEILIENLIKDFDWDAYWQNDDSTRQVFKAPSDISL